MPATTSIDCETIDASEIRVGDTLEDCEGVRMVVKAVESVYDGWLLDFECGRSEEVLDFGDGVSGFVDRVVEERKW